MAELIPVYDDETFPVTAPTFKALADLYAKAVELDTEALTAYAKRNGITPPRAADAEHWDIVRIGIDGKYVGLAWDAPSAEAGQTWSPDRDDSDEH